MTPAFLSSFVIARERGQSQQVRSAGDWVEEKEEDGEEEDEEEEDEEEEEEEALVRNNLSGVRGSLCKLLPISCAICISCTLCGIAATRAPPGRENASIGRPCRSKSSI